MRFKLLAQEMPNAEVSRCMSILIENSVVDYIERDYKNNTIKVTYHVTGDNRALNYSLTLMSDEVEDAIPSDNLRPDAVYLYRQYLIAKGYSELWNGNFFANENNMLNEGDIGKMSLKSFEKRIENSKLSDPFLMGMIFENEKCAKLLIEILLERKDLHIQYVRSQFKDNTFNDLSLIVIATNEKNELVNIIIKRNSSGKIPEEEEFTEEFYEDIEYLGLDDYLTENHVIYLIEKDILGYKLPVYHIGWQIQETKEYLPDWPNTVYVNLNSSAQGVKNDCEKLIHDLNCANSSDMEYAILAEQFRNLRENHVWKLALYQMIMTD